MLNDDFWVLEVFGDIGDHQCPSDLDREDKWRRKSVLTWDSWMSGSLGGPEHLKQAFHLSHPAGEKMPPTAPH